MVKLPGPLAKHDRLPNAGTSLKFEGDMVISRDASSKAEQGR